MISRILSASPRTVFFALGLALLSPVAVMAQDTTSAPSTVVITAADGTSSQYQVTDVSTYVSTIAAYEETPASTSTSISLSTITPIDASLLKWSAQTIDAAKDLRDMTVTTSVTNPDGTKADLVYKITGAHVTTITATNSTVNVPSISLSVEADKLIINDVPLN